MNIKDKVRAILEEVEDVETLLVIEKMVVDNINKKAQDIKANCSSSINEVLVKSIQRIEDLRHKNEDVSGVPSGFPSLDKVTYGWQNTDLIILAARPAVGKTAFALDLVRNAALHPIKPTKTALFSLEMNAEKVVQKLLSAESEIWLKKITRGKLEEHEMKQLYAKGIQRLAQAPIFIDDSPRLTIIELVDKCKKIRNVHGIELIVIDYIQLLSDFKDNSNREQEISRVTRELKILAKELEIPIIALSQLSREVEKRRDFEKMPQLSDLRDSGAIEQDADMVMFLYRPEYYDITQNEMGESNRGETHVRIAKHRNGSLETIKLRAMLHIQKFVEDDNSDSFGSVAMPGSWKPVSESIGSARMFIQHTSADKFDEEDPF